MRIFATIAVALVLAGPASADILLLKDGRIIEDRTLSRRDGGIEIAFENGDVLVPLELVQEAIIEGDDAWEPTTEEEKEKAAQGLVPFEGDWITPDRRSRLIEERVEERRQLVEKIKAHSKWADKWEEKTRYFHFQYTIPPHIFEPYRDAMEAYFKVFAKTWRIRAPRDAGPPAVCFYASRAQFNRVGGVRGGTIGYFRFVKPWELNFYYDRVDPERTEDVMFHETNHYLQLLINPDFKVPHFPGESLAEYYGSANWDPEKEELTVGLLQPGRLTEIEEDVTARDLMSLERIVSEDMYEDYNWGWSLVHFLMADRSSEKRFVKFFRGLATDRRVERRPYGVGSFETCSGEEVWRQFRRHLGLRSEKDVADLEAEWHAYVKKLIGRVGVRGYEEGGFAALNTYPSRKLRARRLLETAIEKGSENPLVFHRYAELLFEKNEHADAIASWRRAIELDPLNAELYADLGYALIIEHQKEEGERLIELALELAPDDPYLRMSIEFRLRND